MEVVITMIYAFSDGTFFSVAFVSSSKIRHKEFATHVSEIDGGPTAVQCLQPRSWFPKQNNTTVALAPKSTELRPGSQSFVLPFPLL